ncbi:lytic polysaccharide monooxygenase [Aaosphaeria arxii CBS 175.79]|uniref:lytic cellulose monooxygenase (C4-dehydrogenating) n=1 Tax=Aaosphaeria arxii CBS 175.79 TaxID=1450172 RepID=A0A6A5Y7K5_9PLEO|nr:lytic polysaccharide monooxygenase [Aaosphaeria arxii CBS 175.79]KAF2020731.1 lytic polysaccharide monooxygenase [Aaosphaeria arxii CBS 175.79]
MYILQVAALCATFSSLASAHGYLKYIEHAGKRYEAWQVGSDEYLTTVPTRYARRIKDMGPVADFTTKDITCNQGGNLPATGIIDVKAGDKVTLIWDQWGSSHSGPVMNYLAKCSPDCSTFKGDTGNVWVKIDQVSYDKSKATPWGSDCLAKNGAKWTVTIPPTIANGEYLLRHEILGLHVAGTRMGAQFYPSCTQIRVTGGGSENPTGIALPGSYNPDDKEGILTELWRIQQGQINYTAPGGPVWKGSVPNTMQC